MLEKSPNLIHKLIIYLVTNIKQTILTRTKMVKLLFLIELIFFDRYKKRLTELEYKSYHYGPYAASIIDAIEELKEVEIDEKTTITEAGNTCYIYSKGNLFIRFKEKDLALPDEVRRIVDEVISGYAQLSIEKILEIVYESDVFKNTPIGEVIEFK